MGVRTTVSDQSTTGGLRSIYPVTKHPHVVSRQEKMNDQKLNIIFVEEIEKHEVLYNYHLPQYSRKDLTEKAWREVGDKVNMSGIFKK